MRPVLPMLRAIQHAHYEHGRYVVKPDVLGKLAADIGLDRQKAHGTRLLD